MNSSVTCVSVFMLCLALPGAMSAKQQRISDCYSLPTREQRDACKAKLGTWEERNEIPRTIFKVGPDYIAAADVVHQLIENRWTFTRVLHDFNGSPEAVGAFHFTADGRYGYRVELQGSVLIEEQGTYVVLEARQREFPQLSLTPTVVTRVQRELEPVLVGAGLMGARRNRFYIAIADAQRATLFPAHCPSGCAANFTQLVRPTR
jgi:hypothetical protein